MGESSHHLPPDNYQDFESVGIAARTSPTNIGLALLSTFAAHDLGYLTPDAAVSRTLATLKTLDMMEKYEGNLYNWYDTTTAEPLHPRYVSYVDSGNLLACLWTLARGYDELLHTPVIDYRFLQGMTDTFHLLRDALSEQPALTADVSEALLGLSRLLEADGLASEAATLEGKIARLRGAAGPVALLAEHLSAQSGSKSGETEKETLQVPSATARYWAARLHEQAEEMAALLERYLGWATVLTDVPADGLSALGQNAHEWRRQALEAAPSLLALARGDVPGLAALVAVRNRADALGLGAETRTWLDRLNTTFEQAQKAARQCQSETEAATLLAEKLAAGINLRFLYDSDRRAFRIGYNVEERKGDDSFYDMLASESRLGGFAAIARGEVPTDQKWKKTHGTATGTCAAISTMECRWVLTKAMRRKLTL